MINRRSFIIGIKSTILNKKEIFFLKKYKPWGIILFKRNIKTIKQTKKLTNHIKKIFNDTKYPILLDQEGGRVNRLTNFLNFLEIYILKIEKFLMLNIMNLLQKQLIILS